MEFDFNKPYVSDTELTVHLGGSEDRRYSIVKRARMKGDLVRLKRGLYQIDHQEIDPFEIAQHLYGPSYISFESALAYHGWIPEAVQLISSASAKRSPRFKTPIGMFTYEHTPEEQFFMGVERIVSDEATFLMAHPWKAVADLMYARRKKWKNLRNMQQDLRIENASLREVDLGVLEEIATYYNSPRICAFAAKAIKEL